MVPIYPTDSPAGCEWVAGDSQATMIVCEDASQTDKIAQVRDRLERLEHVIVIDPPGIEGAISMDELRERAVTDAGRNELERRCKAVSSEDPYTVIYTPGSCSRSASVRLLTVIGASAAQRAPAQPSIPAAC